MKQTKQQKHSKWYTAQLLTTSQLMPSEPPSNTRSLSQFDCYSSAQQHIVLDIPLANLGQLSWSCPLPAIVQPQIPHGHGSIRSWDVPGSVQHCTVITETSESFQRYFHHKSKTQDYMNCYEEN